MKITNQNMLLTVAIVFAAGALLRRVFPVAGLIVIVCALIFYVFCGMKRTVRTLRNFSAASAKSKTLAFVWIGMALLVASVLWVILSHDGGVSYFFVLVLLAADFLLHQKNTKNGK